MQIPVLLKGYKIIELDIYIKFTKIRLSLRSKIIRFDLFADDTLKNPIDDLTLKHTVEKNLEVYTFLPTDTKEERKRMPYYFADTFEEALNLAASKKYQRKVTVSFVNPVSKHSSFSNCDIRIDNGKYIITPAWYRIDIELDVNNIKTLTINTYTWER